MTTATTTTTTTTTEFLEELASLFEKFNISQIDADSEGQIHIYQGPDLEEVFYGYLPTSARTMPATDIREYLRTPEPDTYRSKGYQSRKHYLECLAEDYGVPFEDVWTIADLLGPEEDFDGLVSSIDDMSDLEA